MADEVAHARRLSAKFSWAQLDVTRRSIEETAAAIVLDTEVVHDAFHDGS